MPDATFKKKMTPSRIHTYLHLVNALSLTLKTAVEIAAKKRKKHKKKIMELTRFS